MKTTLFIIMIAITFTFISCTGPTGPAGPTGSSGINDKQIRFEIPANMGTTSQTGFIMTEGYSLIRFNIANYSGVDSVVLSAFVRSHDQNSSCYFDLYNRTDSVLITQSLIQTNNTTASWVTSANFMNELPHKEITLSARIRSQTEGVAVDANGAYMFLYRH
jgi:hypothetical protein